MRGKSVHKSVSSIATSLYRLTLLRSNIRLPEGFLVLFVIRLFTLNPVLSFARGSYGCSIIVKTIAIISQSNDGYTHKPKYREHSQDLFGP